MKAECRHDTDVRRNDLQLKSNRLLAAPKTQKKGVVNYQVSESVLNSSSSMKVNFVDGRNDAV
jgi:hypothetical protein